MTLKMSLNVKKRKIALVNIINTIVDFVEDEENESGNKVKRGKDRTWIKERKTKGAFNNIFHDLSLNDHDGFRRFMRMNYEQFIELCEYVTPIIQKNDTNMRKAICPKERVALTLRFLATGESFRSLEYQFRISRKAISYIIEEVCFAIISTLSKTYLNFPSCSEDWLAIEKIFYEKWNFPHCLGAIDGKHIQIVGCGMGSQYYNYKGTNSILLLIVAGSDYEVIWADVGMNGRVSDGGVLNRSKFGQLLYEDKLNLPDSKPLPYREKPVPYVFIGDDAFALLPNFMKPYSTKKLDLPTRICNYRFSLAR